MYKLCDKLYKLLNFDDNLKVFKCYLREFDQMILDVYFLIRPQCQCHGMY